MDLNQKEPLEVILVDDEAERIQETYKAMLQSLLAAGDISFKSFDNPRIAVEYIAKRDPALVLLDQEMGMEGFRGEDVLERVKGKFDPETPLVRDFSQDERFAACDTQIIFLSAFQLNRADLKKKGAYDVLQKGTDQAEHENLKQHVLAALDVYTSKTIARRVLRSNDQDRITREVQKQREILETAERHTTFYRRRLEGLKGISQHISTGFSEKFKTALATYFKKEVGDYALYTPTQFQGIGEGILSSTGDFHFFGNVLSYKGDPLLLDKLRDSNGDIRHIIDPTKRLYGTFISLKEDQVVYCIVAGQYQHAPSPVNFLEDTTPLIKAALEISLERLKSGDSQIIPALTTNAVEMIIEDDEEVQNSGEDSLWQTPDGYDSRGETPLAGRFGLEMKTVTPVEEMRTLLGIVRHVFKEFTHGDNFPFLLKIDGPVVPEFNNKMVCVDIEAFSYACREFKDGLRNREFGFAYRLHEENDISLYFIIRDPKLYNPPGHELVDLFQVAGTNLTVERCIELGALRSSERAELAVAVSLSDVLQGYTIVPDEHYGAGINNAITQTMYRTGTIPFDVAKHLLQLHKHSAIKTAFPGKNFTTFEEMLEVNKSTGKPRWGITSTYAIFLPRGEE